MAPFSSRVTIASISKIWPRKIFKFKKKHHYKNEKSQNWPKQKSKFDKFEKKIIKTKNTNPNIKKNTLKNIQFK